MRPASSRVIPTRRHMSARSDSRRSTEIDAAPGASRTGGAETGGTSSGRGPGRVERGDDVVRDAAAEDQPFEQAVGGQPIGAVQARAGDLAGGPEAITVVLPCGSTVTPPIM